MKITFICTNYNSIKCGIGMFTHNLKSELEKLSDVQVDVVNKNTFHLKGIKKIISFEMTKEIIKYIKENRLRKDEEINFVVEYPFMDWNPITLLALIYLKHSFKNCKLILSIHEYYRVNVLRRKAVDLLIKVADGYVITDEKLYNKIDCKRKIKRSIPSNIVRVGKNIEKSKKDYCYFGLINKSKAFLEMIEAWKLFNKDGKYNLNIYTASEVVIEDVEKYCIKIFKDLDNKELSKELEKNSFMILPIIPNIDSNNGTLKAAAEHGCIPIGIFSENMKGLGVDIPFQNYSVENMKAALEKTLTLDKKSEMIKLKNYSEDFSFKRNAEDMYSFLKLKSWRA
ncbi:MAG: hypothetical protein ACRCZ2_12865 [Fusobacteriaceae bacterium]